VYIGVVVDLKSLVDRRGSEGKGRALGSESADGV
jgi:hypothetical protein